ncbi:MAG: hypothetical protein ACRDO7_09230 [Nocardioidaceae bacterium]
MSTEPIGWRRMLFGPPEGEWRKKWHGQVAIFVPAAVYGLLLGLLLSQDAAWWLSAVAPLGWLVALHFGMAQVLSRPRE